MYVITYFYVGAKRPQGLGHFWGLPGLLFAVFRVSGSLLDAVGRSQGCCMLFFVFFLYFLYFWRRRRAERRERSERCEAPGLLFLVSFCFLLFSVVFLVIFVYFLLFRLWEGLGASWAPLGAPRAVVCCFSCFFVFL